NSLNKLAINDDKAIGILLLGGTKGLLKGNYTRENIRKVASEQFVNWGGSVSRSAARLNSCFERAKAN
ncbi:MAG: hypothetical protein WBM24_13190, partial [Candidatus Sulfotelmatobacter sp.]